MTSPSAQEQGGRRLAASSSPYLRQHADDPVEWYPWGEAAFARARELERPIFLSIGYASCHWCHVMARESFRDPAIAAFLNDHFVNIKLDREQHPEVDEIYMTATQVLTGQGGWPTSLFLTPALAPYFAGTYFPPEPAHGVPAFAQVLHAMDHAWRQRREDVEEQAAELVEAVRHGLEDRGQGRSAPPGPAVAERACIALERAFDAAHGGFGSAPKFPMPGALLLLLECAEDGGAAASMLGVTLDAMARGGLYDQLGGGFHRYATDAAWRLPHFEKMLTDQGLLLEVYGGWVARTGDPTATAVCRGIAEFLERELLLPEGVFATALDADSEGTEGAFYAWRREELLAVLGEEDFGFAAPLLGFEAAPFFESDRYVLHVPQVWDELAARRRIAVETLLAQLAPLRRRLLAARAERVRPMRDDKILTDANGMAIRGLAIAGAALEDAAMLTRAAAAATALLAGARGRDGRLLHQAFLADADPERPALLGDFTALIAALLALARAGVPGDWLAAALVLREEQDERLAHPAGGYVVASERPDLLVASRDVFDGAVPSGNARAVLNDLELHALTGERRWRDAAAATLAAFADLIEAAPEGARLLAAAARRLAALDGRTSDGPMAEVESGPLAVEPRWIAGWPGPGTGLALEATLEAGWHIAVPEPSRRPASLEIRPGPGVTVEEIRWPRANRPGHPADPAYAGQFTIELRLRREPGTPPGASRLHLRYVACDDRHCLAPRDLAVALPEPI